jgi:hypothetical protein
LPKDVSHKDSCSLRGEWRGGRGGGMGMGGLLYTSIQ